MFCLKESLQYFIITLSDQSREEELVMQAEFWKYRIIPNEDSKTIHDFQTKISINDCVKEIKKMKISRKEKKEIIFHD